MPRRRTKPTPAVYHRMVTPTGAHRVVCKWDSMVFIREFPTEEESTAWCVDAEAQKAAREFALVLLAAKLRDKHGRKSG